MKNNINKGEVPDFRELAPEHLRGGKIKIENIDMFLEAIKEASKEIGFTYSGFIVGDEYIMTRYPRRSFGPVASIETYKNALNILSNKLGVQGKEEEYNNESNVRVLLGLEEGYDEHKKKGILEKLQGEEYTNKIQSEILRLLNTELNNVDHLSKDDIIDLLKNTSLSKTHTKEEVENFLGDEFDIKNAKICTVGTWGDYQESAVIIIGKEKDKGKIYKLAEHFHQARIAVENLGTQKSYMVETKYCEDPDKE